MFRCCMCDESYYHLKNDSIDVYGYKLTYGLKEEVLMYTFCSKKCMIDCYFDEKDPLLKKYLKNPEKYIKKSK